MAPPYFTKYYTTHNAYLLLLVVLDQGTLEIDIFHC